jgi:YVTN family beta-propeller protein
MTVIVPPSSLTIGVGNYPHGVAADPAAGTVYVTNAEDGTVSVIDTATGTVTATIGVGSGPDGVAVDPATGTVYVANEFDKTVSVIDTATGTVTATIGVGTSPFGVAVDPAAGTVFVTNSFDGTVSVIDTATQTVTATIPVSSVTSGVAVDPATHAAYVANYDDGTVSVIRAARTPTALTERIGLSPHRTLTLTATLTAGGRPLRGQPISFTTSHTLLCTSYTSTRGVATCVLTAAQAGRHHDAIRASYPGNASYQPSSATATPP